MNVLKSLFSVRVLPTLSQSASSLNVGAVGGLVLGIEVGVGFAAMIWGIGEPFASLEAYLWSDGSPRLLLPIPFCAFVGLLFGTLMGIVAARSRCHLGDLIRAALLAPMPLLIPIILVAIAAVIGNAKNNVSVRVPEWTLPFQVAATPLTAFAAVGALFWIWCETVLNLPPRAQVECDSCGYSRLGLQADAVCPECGCTPRIVGDTQGFEASHSSSSTK